MTSDELRAVLSSIDLSQADFARLIDVTPRAVSLWMSGERGIPGPADAYARLLQNLTPGQRQVELARLCERKSTMREGMFGIEYASVDGDGVGVLVLENGRIFGADPYGARYDGNYTYDEGTGLADLNLKLTFKPNVTSVFGVSHPYEWTIDVATQMNPHEDEGLIRVATPVGPAINVRYVFMRSMPEA